ncbi:MAG TPA: alpha-1,4-glucan--maltose-1-phosphate maltosyltransferase [Gemmatimonadaceae bacterium]
MTPQLDGGRYPVKRIVGDRVYVGADIIKEGHDELAVRLLHKAPDAADWTLTPMRYDFDSDRWYGDFEVDRIGHWLFTVEAHTDRFITWRTELKKKIDAGQDVTLELAEGARLVRAASRTVKSGPSRATLLMTAKMLEDPREIPSEKQIERALDEELYALMQEYARPTDLTRYSRDLTIVVDRAAARFGAWYELFPRSTAIEGPGHVVRHGTFADAARQLPRIAGLGFDVVYLPPIHPIGRTFRKGKNNSLEPEPDDVGSPWAIGNEHGGHDAIEPALGTFDDFDFFVRSARDLGMEIALDYALQCSPDHPWVKEHPEWFHVRPDGTIKYAENPPKKYQDIYPLSFWCTDRENLWSACRDLLLFWIGRGVTIFRVDNPHTKALAFWEWVIQDVQRDHPDAIFLAEAFTRPKRMKSLAKLGFTMSYTYFTWKNDAWNLRAYLEELTQSPMAEYYRGNLFANTPDILNEYLVTGGRSAFRSRLLLAGTLSPLYGIYSGYELVENEPVRAGSEEYLDSEKYQLRARDFNAPENLNDDIRRLNAIRHAEPALQLYANLSFHTSENPAIVFYRKAATEPTVQWAGATATPVPAKLMPGIVSEESEAHDLLIAVNLDPHSVQETMVHVPIADMGIAETESYAVHDLLTGARYVWRGVRNYIRLEPAEAVGHILRVERLSSRA